MGWWGTDIMDGDSPLNWKDSIADVCGVSFDDEEGYVFTSELLDKKQQDIKASIEGEHWDVPIGYQVWGRLILEYGADLPTEIRDLVLGGLDGDPHAPHDDERKAHIETFRGHVMTYTGAPKKFYEKGLLNTIYEKMAEKESV